MKPTTETEPDRHTDVALVLERLDRTHETTAADLPKDASQIIRGLLAENKKAARLLQDARSSFLDTALKSAWARERKAFLDNALDAEGKA